MAVLVAVALAVTAWWAVRSVDPGALTAVPASPAPAATGSADPDRAPSLVPAAAPVPAAPTATTEIVVDVAGKVRRPGITRLPAGSRVADALEAAGGVRRGVDLRTLNLARPLVDGEQVLVGRPIATGPAAAAAAAPGPTAAASPTPLVSLNTADQATLETLPGVGPVTAQAILQWRTDNGGFSSVDQLLDVSGIGEVTLARLAPLVTL